MSLLSTSHYSQISQAITLLKAQLDEQSRQQTGKFEMISIKLKLLEEQTEEAQRKAKKDEKEVNNRIDLFSNQIKATMKDLLSSYKTTEDFAAVQLQLKQLQNSSDKILRSNQAMSKSLGQKLEDQIGLLEQIVHEQAQQSRQELKSLESQFKQEIDLTKGLLKVNSERIDITRDIESLQEFKTQIYKQIADVRAKRVERKEKFLNLLQAIVVKCKNKNEV